MSLLNVSASPHTRSVDSTQTIMTDVIIALIPTTVFGIYNFGARAAIIIITCITACLLSEYLFEKICKRKNTCRDMSAVLTGLLLALNLPATVPFWMPVVGGAFAIIIVKQLYGGIGQNFMNPALAARCFLLISFSKMMTNFAIEPASDGMDKIMKGLSGINGYAFAEGISQPTELAKVKAGESIDLLSAFLGTHAGTIGETSAAAILLGACYLLYRRVISLRIPAAYLITFVVYLSIYSLVKDHAIDGRYILSNLLLGGIMLGAFFMATDYVTSPVTPMGRIVFGIILGLLTGIFRTLGGAAEGVSYAIILGNILVPLIEKFTMPVPFGIVKEKKKKEAKNNG